jgi:hypothetical protein
MTQRPPATIQDNHTHIKVDWSKWVDEDEEDGADVPDVDYSNLKV